MVESFVKSSQSVYVAAASCPSRVQFRTAMVIIENLTGKTPHQVRLGEIPVIRVKNRAVSIDKDGHIRLFCHLRNTVSESLCPTDFDLAIEYLSDPLDTPIEVGEVHFRTAA